MNWYKYSKVVEKLQQEAGWKQDLLSGSVGACILFFIGYSIFEAAKKMKVPENEVIEALQDDNIVNQAKQKAEEFKSQTPQAPQAPKINSTALVNAILKHENLIPGQTPFRYTNPQMREWNTIHGFEIDKTSPRPRNRKNFIFLKNHDEVPQSVKTQFKKYSLYPQNYGLKPNPTLKEGIEVFDQTGSIGKITYLKKVFPDIDFNKSLSFYFSP